MGHHLAFLFHGIRVDQQGVLLRPPIAPRHLMSGHLKIVPCFTDRCRFESIRHIGDDLHPYPGTAVTREGITVTPIIQQFLHVSWKQDRHTGIVKGHFGTGRDRRRLAGRIISRQDQHAASLTDATVVGMAESVAAAVHARALAIPHAHHTVISRTFEQVGLLAAHQCSRRQFFVDRGHEMHLVLLK